MYNNYNQLFNALAAITDWIRGLFGGKNQVPLDQGALYQRTPVYPQTGNMSKREVTSTCTDIRKYGWISKQCVMY